MHSELVFSVRPGVAHLATPISLADAGLRERHDLQEWIRAHPHILGEGVRIVTFEFSGWRSRTGTEADRLDLLGLDADGRLVVAELKRGVAPDTVEMQAIKYAAYASRFTQETLASGHAAYLSHVRGSVVSSDEALAILTEHAGGELDLESLRRPRIVLVAGGFPPQVTAAAVWLTEMGLDITLVEFGAYRTEHDVILTVSQMWPLPDVEDFTVSPRQAEVRAVEERSLRNREVRAVTTLLTGGLIEDGERLTFDVTPVRVRLRDVVDGWIAEDPRRGEATWQDDSRAPLVWSLDGSTWSPTGLAKEIVSRASGEELPVLRGPRCWVLSDGRTLAQVAGFERVAARDWSRLHAALEVIEPGEWTTYGDLAEVIGSEARPVGQHVTSCPDCPHAYRVLTAGGAVAKQFRWSDEDEGRAPREVLEAEGVRFEGERAAEESRVLASVLMRRLSER